MTGLERGLEVVGRYAEELGLKGESFALGVEEYGRWAYGVMWNLVVVKEVECSYEVVQHAHNFYFLEIVVNDLPLLRRQSVNPAVVPQP